MNENNSYDSGASADCPASETVELGQSGTKSSPETVPGGDFCDSAKRQKILEGARQIFLRDGFDGASMNDITRAAGVSKGTVYAYFRSKEALFEMLIREERRKYLDSITTLDWRGPDFADALYRLGVLLVKKITHPEAIAQLRTVIAASVKFPNIGAAFFEAGPLAGKARLSAYFDQLHAAGALDIPDTTLAASQFVELCRGDFMLRELLNLGKTFSHADIEASVQAAVGTFLKAYRPNAASNLPAPARLA